MKPNHFLLTLAVLGTLFVSAQRAGTALFLKGGTVQTEANIRASYIDSFNSAAVRYNNKTFAVLQFEGIPSQSDKIFLSKTGIELLDYIPDYAYTVSITGKLTLANLQMVKAGSLMQLAPEQKMHPALKRAPLAWSVRIPGTADVWISFPRTFSGAEVAGFLKEKDIDVLSTELQRYRVLSLRIAANRLTELAAYHFIEYVEPAQPASHPLNSNSRAGSRASYLNAAVGDGGRGLNGEGIVVGIGDNADVQTHTDFSGRLINRSAGGAAAHGMHVHGTLAGGGNIDEGERGYAPKATMVSQYFAGILNNAATYVQDYGMVITNNSYGNIDECDYYGTYDLTSRILDGQAFELPSLQHVFASGNSGASNCSPMPSGFSTVYGGYQSAKNILTVGATNDSGAVTDFSSRGPVRDGRTKPEIVAMGEYVRSAWPGIQYEFTRGTSMAAPAVSGGLALLYQRYKQLNSGANPESGLIKALLCNGATDRGNTGPDFSYGYGWMNLYRSVTMMENGAYFSGSSTNGSVNTYSIPVPPNTAGLKVMLYWHDPAASPVSSRTLVNDLDLQTVSPAGIVSLPAVLDGAPAGINHIAVTGADHINNMEQVAIENPVAGNYTVSVKGTLIAENPAQQYFVVYDVLPRSLKLTSPVGGEHLIPTPVSTAPDNYRDMLRITWEASGSTGSIYTLEFSPDGGAAWTNIAANIAGDRRIFSWWVPDVATSNALVRITDNSSGLSSTSHPFTVLASPVLTLAPVQCEGYINLSWSAVVGATDYEVMLLRGEEMVPVAITTATAYTFSGLSKDTAYWVTVRARMNGNPGKRAFALLRQPNNGTCSGAISDNDLALTAFVSPKSGRQFTATALGTSTALTVQIKNEDNAPATAFAVRYSVDNAPWITENVTVTINGGATYNYTFLTPLNLSAVHQYKIAAEVVNPGDVAAGNNLLVTVIKQLQNDPVDLTTPFLDNIEGAPAATYVTDTTGLEGLDRYDFENGTPYGRLRTFINTGIAHSGSKALTLDMDRYDPSGTVNYMTATFNLANYTAALNDIRLDFFYNNHGQVQNSANKVWIRGADTQPWIEAYNLNDSGEDPGIYKKTASLQLSDLLSNNGQVFTPSFQVRWGQFGQYPATDRMTGAGYSFDDIHLYEVMNDVQLVSIDEPISASCGLTATTPVTISLRNNSNTALFNIPVRYMIDNGTPVLEVVPSVTGNTTISYTFTAPADIATLGMHTLYAEVNYAADSFHDNDTAGLTLINTPVITSFPHIQNFENGEGYWYTGGKRSTWEYGTPASYKMSGAASGAKAWKTRLSGNYNDGEYSYLYSPCYDISSMTAPAVSFSVALDIEDCGASPCDGAWMEYSADGKTWNKLGAYGSGTNWYNKSSGQLWSVQNYTRWHVTTIALPAGLSRLRLRFVLKSDEGVNREGIAIDDIHIYDNTKGIWDGPTMSAPVTQSVTGGTTWIDFERGGKLIASLQPANGNMGNTDVQAYINTGAVRYTNNQYYHNRNITVKPTNRQLTDSVGVRFYFLDSETEALLNATGCVTCAKPLSAYQLGVAKYSDPDAAVENGTIADDANGLWLFRLPVNVIKVPFDKGYYAEFKVKDFSEFWLSRGSFVSSTPLPVKLVRFNAQKTGSNALISWTASDEGEIAAYEVEVARNTNDFGANRFSTIGVINSNHSAFENKYTFTDDETAKSGVRYYRLKMVDRDGSFTYSSVRPLLFTPVVKGQVFPNPSSGLFQLVYQVAPDAIVTIVVRDAAGRAVQHYKTEGSGFLQKQTVNLLSAAYAPGIYLLQVQGAGWVQHFKLYKQ